MQTTRILIGKTLVPALMLLAAACANPGVLVSRDEATAADADAGAADAGCASCSDGGAASQDRLQIVSPTAGVRVPFSGSNGSSGIPVYWSLPADVAVALPGLCGSQQRCGHLAVRINGDSCNRLYRSYNARGDQNPLRAIPSYPCEWDPMGQAVITLELRNDADQVVLAQDGVPFQAAVSVIPVADAVGPRGIVYLGSPQGTSVVPGGSATDHVFGLRNRSSGDFAFSLAPWFLYPDQTPHFQVQVVDDAGTPVRGATLASGEDLRVNLRVAALPSAPMDAQVVIQLNFATPSPESRSGIAYVVLHVAAAPSEPVVHQVAVTADDYGVPQSTLSDLAPNAAVYWTHSVNHVALDATQGAALSLHWQVDVSPPDRHSAWGLYDAPASADNPRKLNPGAQGLATVEVASDAAERVTLFFRAPQTRGADDTFAVVNAWWSGDNFTYAEQLPPVILRLAAQP